MPGTQRRQAEQLCATLGSSCVQRSPLRPALDFGRVADFFRRREAKSRRNEMQNLVPTIAVCLVFGCALAPAYAASPSRDRDWWSSDDPALRPPGQNALRVGRVFVAAPARIALTLGAGF
jgi:hypothetical protein